MQRHNTGLLPPGAHVLKESVVLLRSEVTFACSDAAHARKVVARGRSPVR